MKEKVTYTQGVRPLVRKTVRTALKPVERAELSKLAAKKRAGTITRTEKKRFLELGAIDFVRKFKPALEKLSRE